MVVPTEHWHQTVQFPGRQKKSSNAVMKSGELAVLSLFALSAFMSYVGLDGRWLVYFNIQNAAVYGGVLLWYAFAMTKRNRLSIWTAAFWFRVSAGVYYGFGCVYPYIAGSETLRVILSVNIFDDHDLSKLILINYVSTIAVILGIRFGFKDRPPRSRGSERAGFNVYSERAAFWYGLGFLTVGACSRYAIYIPWQFGYFDTVVTGLVVTVSKSLYPGIYLLVRAGLQRKGFLLAFILAVVCFEFMVSVATFSKTEVFLLFIFVFMAVANQGAGVRAHITLLSAFILALSILQPFVLYGRAEVVERFQGKASLSDRLYITREYWSGSASALSGGQVQESMLRLSYVNVSSLVVGWRDQGRSGDTLKYALAIFIPRVLWPDKPIISSIGTELYSRARGHDGSSISAGLFAEAYWNFGWWGIPILLVPAGFIMGLFSKFSISVMASGNWLYMPVVLLGVQMGLRTDGGLVADVLGAGWMAFIIAVSLKVGALLVHKFTGLRLDIADESVAAVGRRRGYSGS
ncbi:hypothetical protein [Mesorhizobium sp.]|uniref:hypothetical protein n=1 Tax=Mesorhizobium sp. TaxID=1871066 RepID=UPI0011FE96E3|nr:hypothetical protein [Mesorhizobium sp.]TIL46156.1 MAG: hypothetical protein E5Y86_08640 [Mesorhizobium sp.]